PEKDGGEWSGVNRLLVPGKNGPLDLHPGDMIDVQRAYTYDLRHAERLRTFERQLARPDRGPVFQELVLLEVEQHLAAVDGERPPENALSQTYGAIRALLAVPPDTPDAPADETQARLQAEAAK